MILRDSPFQSTSALFEVTCSLSLEVLILQEQIGQVGPGVFLTLGEQLIGSYDPRMLLGYELSLGTFAGMVGWDSRYHFWELGKLSFGQTKMPGKSKQNGVSMNTCIFGGSTLVVHTFAACKCFKKNCSKDRMIHYVGPDIS